MPIDTPKQALTLDELPTAGANEPGIQAIVTTATGAKKIPLGVLFEPYSLLIGSYQFYSADFPISFAIPMMGGILDPADFEDNLQLLKQRVPNDWITNDGKVQLPLALDHLLQQDLTLQPGQMQQDAMQEWSKNFTQTEQREGNASSGIGGTFIQSGSPPIPFSLSSVARTAEKTRENTLNGLLCIITGKNNATTTKKYYIIHHEHGAYAGWTVNLPVGKNGQGIGFNPLVMTEKEPSEFNQDSLAKAWKDSEQSDPLGLAIKAKTRNIWDFSHFENIYKTFRIAGKDIFITANIDGVKMMGGDGNDSIVFTGRPAYTSTTLWGSGYGVQYHCTSVMITGSGFSQFTITGLPQVSINYRVKGNNAILSLLSNNKEIDQQWWARLSAQCPSDKLENLKSWLNNMPAGIFNAANMNDTLDNVPKSRFYLHSSDYLPKKPSQVEIWNSFKSATVSDGLGIYSAASLSNFRLSNHLSKEQRTFWIEGFQVEIEADDNGIKFTSKDRYYLRLGGNKQVGSQTTYYGQNQQVIYNIAAQGYFLGTPDNQEIHLTNGWSFKALIAVKEKFVLLSCPGQSTYTEYLDFNKVKQLISFAPAGQEANVREIFENLPKDWENTTNQDTGGENWGIAKARFWMRGD